MKSSLWNIGEMDPAQKASSLETAGKEKNLSFISENIPVFLNELRIIIEKLEIKQQKNGDCLIIQNDNIDFLKNKLQSIIEKASDYDRKSVLDELALIKECTAETKTVLDNIIGHVLHSNFEKAQETAKEYLTSISS